MGAQLSRELAVKYGYPFDDVEDLARVSQFVAINFDPTFPKTEVFKALSGAKPPDFRDPDEPHAFFARLHLPVYMTTNYDDFLTQALKHQYREPRQEVCRWNALLKSRPSLLDPSGQYTPSPANPLVYHLHGFGRSESLVLTEDDYLEFLQNMVGDEDLFPGRVKEALAQPTLLFVGYRVTDWNLRVLLRGLRSSSRTLSVVVLKPPGRTEPKHKLVLDYLEQYYQSISMRVYWGTARQFCAEFRGRLGPAGIGP